MKEELLSLIVGCIVGAVFTLLKLPIPAPKVFSGVLGIAGIYLGNRIVELVVNNWDKIVSVLG